MPKHAPSTASDPTGIINRIWNGRRGRIQGTPRSASHGFLQNKYSTPIRYIIIDWVISKVKDISPIFWCGSRVIEFSRFRGAMCSTAARMGEAIGVHPSETVDEAADGTTCT
jgi:hypothetical protein